MCVVVVKDDYILFVCFLFVCLFNTLKWSVFRLNILKFNTQQKSSFTPKQHAIKQKNNGMSYYILNTFGLKTYIFFLNVFILQKCFNKKLVLQMVGNFAVPSKEVVGSDTSSIKFPDHSLIYSYAYFCSSGHTVNLCLVGNLSQYYPLKRRPKGFY